MYCLVSLNVAQDNNHPFRHLDTKKREAEEVIKKLDKLEVSKDSQEKCQKEEAEENTRKEEKDVKEPEINGTPGRLRTIFLDLSYCRLQHNLSLQIFFFSGLGSHEGSIGVQQLYVLF